MPGKKTSVYLSDEIVGDLQELGLNAAQACRLGIAAEKARREIDNPADPQTALLKAMARTLIEIRDAVKPDSQRRHEIGAQFTSTAPSGQILQTRAECAQCLHYAHEGNCQTECEICIENAAYALRMQQHSTGALGGYSRNTGGPQPLTLPSGIANCTAECEHTAGKHVPAKAGDVKCTDCGHPLANHDEIGHWGCTVRGCTCTLRRSQAAQSQAAQSETAQADKHAAPDLAGVHAAHCCQIHGCKYGASLDCPVYEGSVTQLYACPQCTETDEMETPNG